MPGQGMLTTSLLLVKTSAIFYDSCSKIINYACISDPFPDMFE